MPDPQWEVDLKTVADETLNGILEQLELEGAAVPGRVIYLVPGESVVDDFDDDCRGQLSIRLAALTAHRTADTRTAALTPCSIDYWTAEMEVILTRCAATLDANGIPPAPEVLSAEGQTLARDLRVMVQVISSMTFVDGIPSWTPRGPLGGRAGNRVTFTFKLDAQPCS